MKISIEALEDNQIKATVTIDAADVDARIKSTYKDFAYKYNFPGFRKGKAPRRVIDNALGKDAIYATVTEDLVNDAYPEVIEIEKLYPVGTPTFADPEPVVDGKDFVFEATVSVKPVIELTSYEPVEIEMPFADATESEIEEQINALREHYTTYEDASAATKMKPENFAELTIKATDEEGNAIDTLESDARLYGPGAGAFSEAFDAEIMGMKKGQSKEFTLDIPADETANLLAAHAGKKINFNITINVVKKKTIPELTEEFAKDTMGFDSIEALREQVADVLSMQKAEMLPRIKENNCVSALIERYEGEVSEALAEESEANLLQDFFTQLQQQGVSFDQYLTSQGITADQFKADVKLQAADEAKHQLALDAWARNKGIDASDEEITFEFVRAGLEDPAATQAEWRKNGRLYLIREGVVRAKAMKDVMDTAVITEVDYAAQAQAKKDAEKKPAKKKAAKKEEAVEA